MKRESQVQRTATLNTIASGIVLNVRLQCVFNLTLYNEITSNLLDNCGQITSFSGLHSHHLLYPQ